MSCRASRKFWKIIAEQEGEVKPGLWKQNTGICRCAGTRNLQGQTLPRFGNLLRFVKTFEYLLFISSTIDIEILRCKRVIFCSSCIWFYVQFFIFFMCLVCQKGSSTTIAIWSIIMWSIYFKLSIQFHSDFYHSRKYSNTTLSNNHFDREILKIFVIFLSFFISILLFVVKHFIHINWN